MATDLGRIIIWQGVDENVITYAPAPVPGEHYAALMQCYGPPPPEPCTTCCDNCDKAEPCQECRRDGISG